METKIIQSCFDTFKFERAFVVRASGQPATDPRLLAPRAIISGVECLVDAKPSHLAAGLVFCQPLDSYLAQHWPVYTDVAMDGIKERWWNMTNDPDLVAAVRHFQELQLAGRLVEGMPL